MFVKKIFQHVWPHIMKYKWSFYFTFVFFTLRLFFASVLSVIFFKKIVDIMSDPSIVREGVASELIFLVFVNISIIVAANICSRLGAASIVYFQNNVLKELSDYSFRKIIENSYGFFSNRFTGSLVTKAKRFVRAFEMMHDTIVFNFWGTFVVLAGTFVVIFRQAFYIGLIFLVWVFIYIVVISFFVKKRMEYDISKAEADSAVSGRLADVFSNIFALKVFSASDYEKKAFSGVTDNEKKYRGQAWNFGNIQDAIQATLMMIVQAVVLYFIVKNWIAGVMTTGTLVLIQTYMIVIFDRLWELGKATTKFMEATADMKEVIDIFEIVPDILDPEKPEILKTKMGEIEFKNVSFVYDSGQKVFTDFNLKIKPGERIGLVGHSGAGKSTITKLLLRFVDVSSGEILIDGQDIRLVLQEELRRVISYVPQEPMLFHRSIKENISYSRRDSNEEMVIESAKKAHAHEFILKLRHGYDTLVGERGVKLSGGERQRVVIARAMLKDSPILILDEATSSLDSISEHLIQDAFNELMKGKTTIVIAHRLSTVQKMDRIIVLDNGSIKEEGTHKELLEKNGTYADLWNHQTGGFLD